jgi:hypothetical protein
MATPPAATFGHLRLIRLLQLLHRPQFPVVLIPGQTHRLSLLGIFSVLAKA